VLVYTYGDNLRLTNVLLLAQKRPFLPYFGYAIALARMNSLEIKQTVNKRKVKTAYE
jgi:hypothetical protein